MAAAPVPALPVELIHLLSKYLSGIDLFHFTLINYDYLDISNYYIIRLLRGQSNTSLIGEVHRLIGMYNSPYRIGEDGVGVTLSAHEWSNVVYGPFKINIIQKSLKYYSTTVFCLYSRLWSFSPFYYEVSYPTLDIFSYSYLLEPRALAADEIVLFKILGENYRKPQIVKNFKEFMQNFNRQYGYDDWKEYIDWDLFVIAGGSVILSLLHELPEEKTSDIDLFFLKENRQLFKRAVNELEARLQNKYFVRRKTIWPCRLVQFDLFRKITIAEIFNGRSFTPSIVMQLIRPTTTRTNISRIIHSFDLDRCAAAFNSARVIISFSCLQALNSGYTVCYAIPKTPSEFMRRVPRLLKYQRRGFNILCPKDFDVTAFLATSVEDCKEIRSERIYRFRRQHFGDNCDSFLVQKKFCEYYSLN